MGLNRRNWLKSAALIGGYGLLNGVNSIKPLTPNEHIKFNPRLLSDPIRLSSNESIVITGGSTEGLKIAGITFTASGGEIIAAKPTFLAMMQYAQMWGANINWVPVDDNYGYDLQEIEKRISSKTKMVFICNPNNPTSTLLPANSLLDFCNSVSRKTIVFSDEAYYDYIDTPNYPLWLSWLNKTKILLYQKHFQKFMGWQECALDTLLQNQN